MCLCGLHVVATSTTFYVEGRASLDTTGNVPWGFHVVRTRFGIQDLERHGYTTSCGHPTLDHSSLRAQIGFLSLSQSTQARSETFPFDRTGWSDTHTNTPFRPAFACYTQKRRRIRNQRIGRPRIPPTSGHNHQETRRSPTKNRI
jgi:hypothetical protein